MRRITSIVLIVALALGCIMSTAGVAVAAAGSIEGFVYEEGTANVIPNATVYAYDWSTDIELNPNAFVGTGFTDQSGHYVVPNLPSGSYRAKAEADGYFSEYYNNKPDSASADAVLVTDPNPTMGINFTLVTGGSLSGSVYDEIAATPIEGAHVIAYNFVTGQMVDDGWTSDNGSYTIGNNMYPGNHRVKADADGYFSKYYDNVTDSDAATAVPVTVLTNTPGINFTLTRGGSISGSVQTDNGTPIFGAHIIAYDFLTGEMVDDGWTTDNGTYTVGNNIDSGSYRVMAEADGYFSEYFDNRPDSASADPVTVEVPDNTPDIDFVLAAGGSIKGFVYEEGTLARIHNARVMAFDNVTAELIDEAWSLPNGSYVLGNSLYPGNYILQAEADGYFTEYFDNVTSISMATPVQVTALGVTEDKNFTLSIQTLSFSDISANVTGENTATITWTTDQPGTSQVEYGPTDQYGSATTLDENPMTSHTVDLTGLTRATTYHYRVKSKDALGREAHSDDYFFTTPDLTKPMISDVAATDITITGATITWKTDELAESQVEYGTAASYGETTPLDTNLVTDHIVILTGLASSTSYHYKVKSRDSQGSGLWAESEDYTFTTLTPPDITAPVISQVSATSITQTGATIIWTTDEAATSQVEYGLTDQYGSATTLDSTLVTSHSVNLTGLTAGTIYHYRVKSKDAADNEAQSGDYTFTTASVPVPPVDTTPPTTPVVTDDGDSTTSLTQLHASWTSSDPESGIVEYQYAIGTSAGGNDVVDWTSVGTDTGVTRTGLTLSAGTTYYFSVKAQNGEELWSAIGTTDGISVQEEPAPEEPSDDGGMPAWVWAVIGLGGAAVIGGLGYWLIKGMPKQPQQQ